MIPPEHVQKLFASPVFLFAFYTLITSVVAIIPNNDRPWTSVALFAVPASAFMTFLTLHQLKRIKDVTGLSEPAQLRALYKAYKSDELPSDPHIRKGMPGYLAEQMRIQETAKQSVRFIYALAVINLAIAFITHNPIMIVFSAMFAGAARLNQNHMQKTIRKIEGLQRQLENDPNQPGISDSIVQSALSNRLRVSAVIGLAIFVLFLGIVVVEEARRVTPLPISPSTTDSEEYGPPSPAGPNGPSIEIQYPNPQIMPVEGDHRPDEATSTYPTPPYAAPYGDTYRE